MGARAHVGPPGVAGILTHLLTQGSLRGIGWGLGQCVSQLTYNSRDQIGNGSTERVDGGVSDYGVRMVQRINQLGMAVDVSHSADQTTLDACEVSRQRVLFTHSNAGALVSGHPRCKTEEAIRRWVVSESWSNPIPAEQQAEA